MFVLNKFSLVILTRCNLACKLCCEYVPQNKPFPDMTVAEAERILEAAFSVADRITTLHLTGGGEPFLHPNPVSFSHLTPPTNLRAVGFLLRRGWWMML